MVGRFCFAWAALRRLRRRSFTGVPIKYFLLDFYYNVYDKRIMLDGLTDIIFPFYFFVVENLWRILTKCSLTYFIRYYTLLYIIQLYIIHYTLYTIHYTLYTIHYTLYTIHYTLYTIHYTLYTIHYTLYNYALYNYTLYNYTLYNYTLYNYTLLYNYLTPFMQSRNE